MGKDERTWVTLSEWRTTEDRSPWASAAPERSVNLRCLSSTRRQEAHKRSAKSQDIHVQSSIQANEPMGFYRV